MNNKEIKKEINEIVTGCIELKAISNNFIDEALDSLADLDSTGVYYGKTVRIIEKLRTEIIDMLYSIEENCNNITNE